jgi:hypothetical protein
MPRAGSKSRNTERCPSFSSTSRTREAISLSALLWQMKMALKMGLLADVHS